MNHSVLDRKTLTSIASPNGKTVLVVDDQPAILGLIRDILEDAGYVALVAESGAEALMILGRQSSNIDLILTDVQMPRMDGIQLAQCLADRAPELPVVFMTGYSAYLKSQNALAAHHSYGGHGVVRKPFRAAELVNRVDKMIGRSCPGTTAQHAER